MNRDEKRSRIKGRPPRRRIINGRFVLGPSEPGGGSWIVVNEIGGTLALVNWYRIQRRVGERPVSRGDVVTAAGASSTAGSVDAVLEQLPLRRINPFRLVGVFPADRCVTEWQWDLKRLVRKDHSWRWRQWISSGFDEPRAQKVRTRAFRQAGHQSSAGTLAWLRRLHRSHAPARGPFSTCMHRDDAVTVSYTEVVVGGGKARMAHAAEAPCHRTPLSIHKLTLSISKDSSTTHRQRRVR